MRYASTPSIGPAYWIAIAIASVFGANLGDFVSHDLGMGHWRGVPFLAAGLAAVIAAERASRRGGAGYYWAVVVLLRTAATNVADLLTHDLHLSPPGCILALSAGFVPCALWASDPARSRTGLPRADHRYWLALFGAGTIGTVVGDWVAGGWGLGTLWGSVVLGAATLGALAWRGRRGEHPGRTAYWWPILGVRSAGTTVGDVLAAPALMGLAVATVVTGIAFAGAAMAGRRDGGASEVGLDEREGGVDAGSDPGEAEGAGDRDQRGDQAVFDGGDGGSVVQRGKEGRSGGQLSDGHLRGGHGAGFPGRCDASVPRLR